MVSVTECLSPFNDFSAVPPAVLEAACERGSQVHANIASILKGLWVPEIPENCQPYIDSFNLWLPVVEEVVMVEETLVDKEREYKGTPDAILRIKGDEGYTLVDWKSPVVESKSWRLQISAYRALAMQNGYLIHRTGALQLSPKGRVAKFREYSGTLVRDFATFLCCLSAYKFFHKEK
jgi:hypothetical protein